MLKFSFLPLPPHLRSGVFTPSALLNLVRWRANLHADQRHTTTHTPTSFEVQAEMIMMTSRVLLCFNSALYHSCERGLPSERLIQTTWPANNGTEVPGGPLAIDPAACCRQSPAVKADSWLGDWPEARDRMWSRVEASGKPSRRILATTRAVEISTGGCLSSRIFGERPVATSPGHASPLETFQNVCTSSVRVSVLRPGARNLKIIRLVNG